MPPSLDLPEILNNLTLSGPNLSGYPIVHKYYRDRYAVPPTMTLVTRLERLGRAVTSEKNGGLGALVDLDGLDFPSAEMLWTIFIIGDKGERGPIHYCIPSFIYTRLQYIRVHFLVPEWNFPGYDTHRYFWYGHPQYVGPEPPQESVDSSSPPKNNPVAATRTAVPASSQQQTQTSPSAAGQPLVEQPYNPFLDLSLQTPMPQPQMSASTLGLDHHPDPNHTANALGLSFNPTTGQQHIPLGQQMYGQPPGFQPPVFQPSVFQPSVLQPPVFQPSVFQPSVLQPPVFQPPPPSAPSALVQTALGQVQHAYQLNPDDDEYDWTI